MNRIFLDISSTCTGYCIHDGEKHLERNVIWFPKDLDTAQKCHFLFHTVFELCTKFDIQGIVFESYVFNTSRVSGSLVLPHLQGAIMVLSEELSTELDQITPQTWRKNCGIKPVKDAKGKRDYKTPTESYFRAKYELPEKIVSNVTGNERTVPSDYFDALGICEGWMKRSKE